MDIIESIATWIKLLSLNGGVLMRLFDVTVKCFSKERSWIDHSKHEEKTRFR